MNSIRIIFLFLAFLLLNGCASRKELSDCDNIFHTRSTEYLSGILDHNELRKEWISEEIEYSEVRNWLHNYYLLRFEEMYTTFDSANFERSLNWQIDKWSKVEDKISELDKIFYYNTPEDYWKALAGQDGLVVLRGCEIIYVMVLFVS
jgi:hypothetical protein